MPDPTEQSPFAELREGLAKCIRCGQCRTVCPVFAVQRQEKFTARGKVALVAAADRGEVELDEAFHAALSNCLLCMACVAKCGNGTPTADIVLKGRAAFLAKQGLPAVQRLVYAGLTAGKPAMQAASAMQKLLFKRLPKTSGLRRRFPLPFVDKDQLVPRLADAPFRSSRPELSESAEHRGRVLFFTGCMANYAYPGIAEAVVRVLNALGVDVLTPAAQECCGAPMYLSGDAKTARARALRNLEALRDAEDAPVVVACSSGGMMLKTHYPTLLAHEAADRARALAARTMDISEYLVRVVGTERIAKHIVRPLADRTTYHDPCHLNRGQGVHEEPRQLLALACREPLVEMSAPDRCCGLAGTYSLVNRSTSRAIQTAKVEDIAATGAQRVATGCPGCILQLDDGMLRHGVRGSAHHVVELLASAMGLLDLPDAPDALGLADAAD